MNAEPESPETSSSDRGVFGNLPSQRPGVRSPRRRSEGEAERGQPAKAGAAKKQAPRKPSPPPPPPREPAGRPEPSTPRPSAAPPEEQASPRGAIQDVAWAGVTVAAEAATLGVRLFSRALEAVRERR